MLVVMIAMPLLLFFVSQQNHKVKFDHIEACFTPAQGCTKMIIRTIKNAKDNIHVQAYTWTSKDISQALIDMHNQGVKVHIILDKVNMRKNAAIYMLEKNNIRPLIDYVPGIAHNKIIILDDDTVITGSFNFSESGEKRNVENILKIQSKELNKLYKKNWQYRAKLSQHIDHVDTTKRTHKPWK